MGNKYLEKIAKLSEETKKELGQTAVMAGAGGATGYLGAKLMEHPRVANMKMSNASKSALLVGGLGLLGDYGAVKINNMIGKRQMDKQANTYTQTGEYLGHTDLDGAKDITPEKPNRIIEKLKSNKGKIAAGVAGVGLAGYGAYKVLNKQAATYDQMGNHVGSMPTLHTPTPGTGMAAPHVGQAPKAPKGGFFRGVKTLIKRNPFVAGAGLLATGAAGGYAMHKQASVQEILEKVAQARWKKEALKNGTLTTEGPSMSNVEARSKLRMDTPDTFTHSRATTSKGFFGQKKTTISDTIHTGDKLAGNTIKDRLASKRKGEFRASEKTSALPGANGGQTINRTSKGFYQGATAAAPAGATGHFGKALEWAGKNKKGLMLGAGALGVGMVARKAFGGNQDQGQYKYASFNDNKYLNVLYTQGK